MQYTGMIVTLFVRRHGVALHPATDYLSVLGDTGVGPQGRSAVSVTDNAYRGPYCVECKAEKCPHIDAVHAARAAGTIPPLDPITGQHEDWSDEAQDYVPLTPYYEAGTEG